MPKARRSICPKPRNRSSFAVRSLISNSTRRVQFTTKSNSCCSNSPLIKPASSSTDSILHEPEVSNENSGPTERGKAIKQTWKERKGKVEEEWLKLTGEFVETWTKEEAAIEGKQCVLCNENDKEVVSQATIRCRDCGYNQFFCEACAIKLHSNRCSFHLLEKWEVSMLGG